MDNVSENKDYKWTLKSDTLAKQWRLNVTQKGKLSKEPGRCSGVKLLSKDS